MALYEDRVNLNVLGQISFLFLHFILFLIVSKFVKCKNTYLLNNLRKDMGVFFCYALLIGPLAMSFQNGL